MRWGSSFTTSAGLIALLATVALLSTWTGESDHWALDDVARILLTSAPLALAWIAAAIGYGWPLRRALAPDSSQGTSIQIAAGVAALMFLDQALGRLGLLQVGGRLGAILLTAAGIALLILQIRAERTTPLTVAAAEPSAGGSGHWLRRFSLIFSAFPLAVLLVAACSAPGWLWATEFGGYDALSYHLQLPREWAASGSIQPVQHNVYSFLPSYVEGAYYHLAILRGDAIEAAYACQLLHALFAALTCVIVVTCSGTLISFTAGSIGALLFISTPWIVVVGSLAYNEAGVMLMLAAGIGLLLTSEQHNAAVAGAPTQQRTASLRSGALLGLLAAAACGAKLTAIGFVAAPLLSVMLLRRAASAWLGVVVAGAVVIVVLCPYLLHNYASTGNPVFPFAGSIFGFGHWTSEQAHLWASGHQASLNFAARLELLWQQFFAFGIGPNPLPHEPWKPQWAALPWLGVLGLAIGMIDRRSRRMALVLSAIVSLQILFWISFTHLKSRFLIPAAVPLSMGAAIGLHVLHAQWNQWRSRHVWNTGLIVVLGLLSLMPIFIFCSERNRAPAAMIGQHASFTGSNLPADVVREFGSTAVPSLAVNHLLPNGPKVLLIGHATPFYYDLERVQYNTTWDRGLLSALMRQFPDDPGRWAAELRRMGFTHLLVDETMLRIWERSGWNDPLLTVQQVRDFTTAHAELLYTYPNQVQLFRISS